MGQVLSCKEVHTYEGMICVYCGAGGDAEQELQFVTCRCIMMSCYTTKFSKLPQTSS